MYSKMFKSKKISIRDYHMEKLLERFDHNKFKRTSNEIGDSTPVMQNRVPCVLCKSFNPHGISCGECPLAKFRSRAYTGCGTVFRTLIPGPIILRTYAGSVVYNVSDEKKALKGLKTTTDFLKSFKKE